MKPFLKWAGGKTKLLAELTTRVPRFRRYHEPFLGGGALFFHLLPQVAFLNDANRDLISTYASVRDEVHRVIGQLRQMSQTKDQYYEVRKVWNSRIDDPCCRAAAFIYLNKTCFNGLWRVNARGHFNVPYRHSKARFLDADTLQSASQALQPAFLTSDSFESAMDRVRDGDFVYCDPPYHGTFSSYTPDGFDDHRHRVLASMVSVVHSRGAFVMASNTDTPLIRSIYKRFRVTPVNVRHSIAADGECRSMVGEVIITNY